MRLGPLHLDPKPIRWDLGAAIFLFTVWLLMLAAHGACEYLVALEGHESVPWKLEWARGVFENLQSEVWQVWLAAWTFKHLRWVGSPESK